MTAPHGVTREQIADLIRRLAVCYDNDAHVILDGQAPERILALFPVAKLEADHESDLASIADCVNTALRECERGGAQIASWDPPFIKGAIDELVFRNTAIRRERDSFRADVAKLEAENARLEKMLANDEQRIREGRWALDSYETEVVALRADLAALRAENAAQTALIEESAVKLGDGFWGRACGRLLKKVETLRAQLVAAIAAGRAQTDIADTLQGQFDRAIAQRDEAETKLADAERVIAVQRTVLTEHAGHAWDCNANKPMAPGCSCGLRAALLEIERLAPHPTGRGATEVKNE